MATAFWAMVVAAIPLTIVIGLLRLADRFQQRRDASRARQIELTDAIHREMGAAAAPRVERRWGRGWRVRMMVPLDKPVVVAAILRVTGRVFAPAGAGDALQIVLVPRCQSRGRAVGAARSPRRRPVQPAASIAGAIR